MSLKTHAIEQAREAGPIEPGHFRVVTLEPSGRWSVANHKSRGSAKQHADDAASEDDDRGGPLSYVVSSAFKVVHEGKPWWR